MEDKTQLENLTKIEGDRQKASSNHFIKNFREYVILKEIPAKGAEADNFLIQKDQQTFFLKLYRKGIQPNLEVLNKLKGISQKFRDHLVEIFEVGFDPETERFYEILEYIQHGDLKQYIQEISGYKQEDKEKILDKIIQEVAESLKCLHDNGIVHRDLKPSNILIRSKDPLNIVHIDFGISKTIDDDVSKVATTHFKGTVNYIAPEEISNYFGKEIDWWHLGMIVYEILAGKNPFTGMSEATVIHLLTTKGIEIPSYFPEKYQILLKGLLTRNYEKRWKYKQIEEWLKGKINIPVYYEVISEEIDIEEDWEKWGIPKESIWRKLGLEPEKTLTFKDAGFGFNEAKLWVEAGWTNGELARKWFEEGFDPIEAKIFENTGLSKSQAKLIKSNGINAFDLEQAKNNADNLDEFINKIIDAIKQGKDPQKVIRLYKIRWKDIKKSEKKDPKKTTKLLEDLIKNKDTKIDWKNLENNQ
jgi:serine/threonine protein kinase